MSVSSGEWSSFDHDILSHTYIDPTAVAFTLSLRCAMVPRLTFFGRGNFWWY